MWGKIKCSLSKGSNGLKLISNDELLNLLSKRTKFPVLAAIHFTMSRMGL